MVASADGHGVADADVGDVFEARRDVAHVSGGERRLTAQVGGEAADFHRFEASVGGGEAERGLTLGLAVDDAHVGDDAFVGVVLGVEDERAERLLGLAFGGRDALDDGIEQLGDALPGLGGDVEDFVAREADHVDQLGGDRFGPGDIEVDLVDDGDQGEVLLHGEVDVGQRLGLDALDGVDDEERALGGGQAAGDLVGEVHVAGRVDQVEAVVAGGVGAVLHAHRASLDRDALLALQVHGVEELVGHVARVDGGGGLNEAVGEG